MLKTSYWVPSDKVQDGNVKTCINEQADGSCESIHIPECVDRTVKCSALPNPTGVEVCKKKCLTLFPLFLWAFLWTYKHLLLFYFYTGIPVWTAGGICTRSQWLDCTLYKHTVRILSMSFLIVLRENFFHFQIYDLYVCTSIRRYECADRNWYFGYNIPEGDDFVSYHYTTNIRDITITCNNHS